MARSGNAPGVSPEILRTREDDLFMESLVPTTVMAAAMRSSSDVLIQVLYPPPDAPVIEPLLRDSHQQRFYPAVVARPDTPLALSEWLEDQHYESLAGHRRAKGLEIRLRLAVLQPVSGVVQNGRRPTLQVDRYVEMGRNQNARQRLIHDLFDVVSQTWRSGGHGSGSTPSDSVNRRRSLSRCRSASWRVCACRIASSARLARCCASSRTAASLAETSAGRKAPTSRCRSCAEATRTSSGITAVLETKWSTVG